MNENFELYTTWPCRAIEDFPVHFLGPDAASLLACWTALWHPVLVARSGKIPNWLPCDRINELPDGCLLTIPTPALRKIDDGQQTELKARGIRIFKGDVREELCNALKASIGDQSTPQSCPHGQDRQNSEQKNDTEAISVRHFFALGWAQFQIQLLTRQLRYSSGLDLSRFGKHVVEAAHRLLNDDNPLAKTSITSAFDMLLEEKNCYYPTSANLMDLVLAHPNVITRLVPQIENRRPQNWLVSGATAIALASDSGRRMLIQEAFDRGQLEVIGGQLHEGPELLLDTSSSIENIRLGRDSIARLTGTKPTVYGRFRAGLHPTLPAWLGRMGYAGALHLAFEGETIPPASAPLFSWQADDGAQLSSISGMLLDASRPESFLKIGVAIGEQIDSYHSATVVLAHWPGEYHDHFEDFLIANRFGDLFGKFRLARDVFEGYYNPGYGESFEYDFYRPKELTRLVSSGIKDPHSKLAAIAQVERIIPAIRIWMGNGEILSGRPSRHRLVLGNLTERLLSSLADLDLDGILKIQIEAEELLDTVSRELVQVLGGNSDRGTGRRCFLNPGSVPQKIRLGPGNSLAVPAYGFAVADSSPKIPKSTQASMVEGNLIRNNKGGRSSDKTKGREGLVAERLILRNEHFNVSISSQSGGIQSVKRYTARAQNILSQQLALKTADPENGESPVYSRMMADSIECEQTPEGVATVIARGSLRVEQDPVATFEQRTTIYMGSSQIDLDIEIRPQIILSSKAWNHYFGCRIAWLNEGAKRHRRLHNGWYPCYLDRFMAPSGIWIDDVNEPFLIDSRGLPFHCQTSLRSLDTLLITTDDKATRFQMSLMPLGAQTRPSRLADSKISADESVASEGVPNSAQFFKLSPGNFELIDVSGIIEGDRICGARIMAIERFNESGRYRIGISRPLVRGQALDLDGNFLQDVELENGDAVGSYRGRQVLCLNLFW